jgi:thiamine biosynthesis lipoprotein
MIAQEQRGFVTGRFEAMKCPCEILIETTNASLGAAQLEAAIGEARRIEEKYSRYRRGNVIEKINAGGGKKVEVDEETAALLDYAAQCHDLSDGLFDITTGVLREIWRFDGAEMRVDPKELSRLRGRVGWEKILWERPFITLPLGFQIDLGGICKEYAADKILELLRKRHPLATLVNLGGDIAAAGKRWWSVGIEDVNRLGESDKTVAFRQGGLATSGTTKRFVRVNGEMYSHILNPKTGWPVKAAPRSVTVSAKTCTEAGFWSTLAVLRGEKAEVFLKEQGLTYWLER